jgi:hypothetical protein
MQFLPRKKQPENLGYFCIFLKTAQSELLPNLREFAQSGQTDAKIDSFLVILDTFARRNVDQVLLVDLYSNYICMYMYCM